MAFLSFIILTLIIILYSLYLTNIRTVEYTVVTDKIKSDINILHITDLHIKRDSLYHKDSIKKYNFDDIDVLVLSGDFTDTNSAINYLDKLLYLFDKIPIKIAVLGNHDYELIDWINFIKPHFINKYPNVYERDTSRLVNIFKKHNITILNNSTYNISLKKNKLHFVGIGDSCSFRNDDRLLNNYNEDSLNIFVTHTPYPKLFKESMADIIFCGHSHGGQIFIPLFGPLTSNSKGISRKMANGLFKIADKYIIMSRGVGYHEYFPFRFFCSPEIIEIKLRKK